MIENSSTPSRFRARSLRQAPAVLWLVMVTLLLLTRSAGADEPAYQEWTEDDIPGQFVVDLRDDLSDSQVDAFATEQGLELDPTSPLTATTRMHVAAAAAAEVAGWVARLRSDPRIEYVEPLAMVHASWVPDDPLLEQQWHLERVGAKRAWAFATGRGVTVAVIDTGVACEDTPPFSRGSDLADTWCLRGFSFVDNKPHANDDHGHGTHVAGTIAQSTNNALGAAGLAFRARILPVKVLSANGSGTTVAVADGIRYAADAGAHVINLSLGSRRASRVIRTAIDHARSKGVIVVAAAGNNGRVVDYPGAFPGVVAVSATDSNDKLAFFSSRGKEVDIAAPGVNVLQQTICNGGHDKCERFAGMSGTSMASPHVAGAAALLMGVGVVDPNRVEAILKQSARVVGDAPGGPLFGAGILDAGAAVSGIVWKQALWRVGLVVLLTLWVVRRIRRHQGTARPWRPGFVVAAMAFGPGLLFVIPLVFARVSIPVDLLARPVPEWDLLLGVSVHRWLPLANFLIPLGLSAIGFGFKRLRPAIAGVAIGTAAYAMSLPILGQHTSTLRGLLTLVVFALVNLIVCLWLAALNLDERERV